MTPIDIRPTPFDDPVAVEVHERYLQDIIDRYGGPPGCLAPATFEGPAAGFFLAWIDGVPGGCGGFRRHDEGVAEIKRMYVEPTARGRGVARALLARLEEAARAAGYRELWLETGTRQPEAIALYESSGYTPIARYGEFKADERSRCYAKRL